MKKLIPLLLVLMSVSLFSQESVYWEKIDFQFDSGIKIIDMYQNIEGYHFDVDNAFIIVTQNNKIYLFEDILTPGIFLNNLDTNIIISKAKIIRTFDSTFIFLISSDNKLMMTRDFGSSWKIFGSEIDNSYITDIAYWNSHEYYEFSTICISNTFGEAYITKDYGSTWQRKINGLQNNKITHLSASDHMIFCLTEDNSQYSLYENLDSWEKQTDISEINNIKEIRILENSFFVYMDENQKLKYPENQQKLKEVEITNNIPITCFTVSQWYFLVLGVEKDPLPFNYFIIIGTDKHGVYFHNISKDSAEQISNELIGLTITDVETNSLINPAICLIGTKEGELYYGYFPDPPDNVAQNSENNLYLKFSPQPASTKAQLSFTLPMESRVSVKLYNTLGIEQFAISDDFFSEGENSIPLDVSGLADGMYFVTIQYDGKTVVEKLVVRR
ncbi:MAG: T9SS type A sorting domain-containing protein [bacterium]